MFDVSPIDPYPGRAFSPRKLGAGTFGRVEFEGPVSDVFEPCERILRTLPRWFGIESALAQYVRDTASFLTFVAKESDESDESDESVAFATVRKHFPTTWEVHCIAVQSTHRRRGVGRALHAHVEGWLAARGARVLQVKTLADSHPSPEYAETRRFYAGLGYAPLEVFPELWGPGLPVLQLLKLL